MTKGQKKRLAKEAQQLEDEDHGACYVDRSRCFPVAGSRSWRSSVLTSVFQAGGYDCCIPVDILSGWDVFKAEDRRMLEERIRHEQPYLLSFAWPCGPWSPWQRIHKDQDGVYEKRRLWLPVFKWMRRVIEEHQQRGGKTALENPWASRPGIPSRCSRFWLWDLTQSALTCVVLV